MVSRILLVLAVLAGTASASKAAEFELTRIGELVNEVRADFSRAYGDPGNAARLGAALAVSGVFANTPLDGNFQRYYQGHISSDATDSASDIARLPGEAVIAVPALAGTYLLAGNTEVKGWAGDSLRALAIGAPAGLFLQYATGGGRPEEGDSHWRPFKNNNGLSGHAFIGSVPFIAAAKRTDSPYLKTLAYGLSALSAASRINDDKHFLSQAALGWYLGYLSVNSINSQRRPHVALFPYGDAGLMVRVDF